MKNKIERSLHETSLQLSTGFAVPAIGIKLTENCGELSNISSCIIDIYLYNI